MEKEREEFVDKLKIAECLKLLPSKHLINSKITEDQLNLFHAYRVYQKYVAEAWLSKFIPQNDPLRPMLNNRVIDRNTYNQVWHVTDWYEKLWGLVQLGENYIQMEFKALNIEYPFRSAFHLFARIIFDWVNSEFSICLKGYIEVSRSRYVKAYQLLAKRCQKELSLDEEQYLEKIFPQSENVSWLNILLAVCHSKVSNQRTPLKSRLEDFYTASERLFETEATSRRKGGSFAWRDGKLGKGTKAGTYDFS